MRVLFVSPFPPTPDGIGRYTQRLLDGLVAAGHEAAVVVPRKVTGHPDWVIGGLGVRRADLVTLRDVVLDWRPDVVHVQFAVAAFGTRILTLLSWLRMIREAGIPTVMTMHEAVRETAMPLFPGRVLYRALEAVCSRMIVHSKAPWTALTEIVGMPPEEVTIIPHPDVGPPDTVTSPQALRARYGLDGSDLLLAFGFVHVDKGLGDLVTALGTLVRAGVLDRHDVRLAIVGEVRPRHGPFRLFELRDRVHLARVLRSAERELPGRPVLVTGYAPEDEVAAWFQVATAAVIPYRRIDNSGVASLARAFGTPVLASTAGGLGDAYANSPWSFPPCEPDRLAAAIARFLAAKPDERSRVVSSTPVADLPHVVAATVDVYRVVTTSKTGPVEAWSQQDAT
jgi:glycosyltransferase involved in cell wall biosynthesis